MAKRGGRSGRRYVRDNRGRFATTGATARGGRLKTASGKNRATQTVKAKTGGKPAGAIKGKIKRSPGAAKPAAAKPTAANSARATGKLTRPLPKGNIRRTGGRLGPKNTIKPGPKSPRTKMNRAIDNVIKKGKDLKGSAEKLRGVKKQADALRGRMLKEDKGRLSKALSKPSVTDKRSRDYGGRLTKGARGQDPATGGKKSSARRKAATGKPAAAKPAAAKPTSARDAATARLKIKTATRRKLKADRSSVIPANPKARRVQSARIGSTVAKKARAKGNAPATIANRVKRKAAVNKANLRENTRYGNVVDGKQYERQIKTSMTLDRAQNYLKTGQKGKPTEKARRALLAAKRAPEMAAARTRLDAKRAARRKADTGKPAAAKPAAAKRRGAVGKISEAKAGRIVARMDAQRGRKALPGRRNANFARTYERSRQFILKPSAAALKKGKPISVNESVQKAVANAAKRRKPKRRRS